MKIECIKDKLGEAVGRAEKIAGKNPTLPVLSGLYLKAEKSTLSIKATNLDLGISIVLPVKVIEDGEIVVPAAVLNSFLASLAGDKTITFTTKDNTLEVKTSGAKTTIKTLPVDEFPLIPELPDDLAFSMPAKDLALGLKSVAFAASAGSIKPELASILVSYKDNELVFVATDSFRLAEKQVKVKKIPHFKDLLIPQKNALELVRLFDKDPEEVSVSLGESQAAFRKGSMYVASRTVEGTFPDYRQIIPKEAATKAVILKEDLLGALKTNLVFSDAFNQLVLTVDPKEKKFEIESKNSQVGENISSVEASLEGEPMTISVNHRYLTDGFAGLASDSLSLSLSPGRPILVEGVGDKSYLYLVMPMNR